MPAIAIALLMWAGRGLYFLGDDWTMVLERRGGDLDAFLRPHAADLVIVEVLVYKALLALAGTGVYWPYRLTMVLAHLACLTIVFVVARRRVGPVIAGALTAPLVLFGAASGILLFPSRIGLVVSVIAGLGAMLALERDDRRRDVLACALLIVALAGSVFGLPLAVGAAAALLARGAWWRRLWVAALPVALYGAWYLAYDAGEQRTLHVGVGAAVLMAALAASGWWLWRRGDVSPQLAMLAVTLPAFAVVTVVTHQRDGRFDSDRFWYPAAVLLVLLIAEAPRAVRLGRRTLAAALVVAAAAAGVDAAALVDDGDERRAAAQVLVAELAAVEEAPARLPEGAAIDPRAPGLTVVRWQHTLAQLGRPDFPPSALASAPEPARFQADRLLLEAVRRSPLPRAPRPGLTAAVSGSAAPLLRRRGACLVARESPAPVQARLQPPAYGLAVRAAPDRPLVVRLRRFAQAFGRPVATLGPGEGVVIAPPIGFSPVPWVASITGGGRFVLC
ncbi:MAG TPA: hypothetical protein VF549_14060 [Solirubrobacteraceae bacterium]